MKSGKKILFIKKMNINLDEYQDAHLGDKCKGKFELEPSKNDVLSLGDLGPLKLPVVPYLTCSSCGASYLVPGFQEGVERFLAIQMILSSKMLTKKQLRFLRIHFGLTQQEIVDKLGMTDRQHYHKMESKKYELHMSPDKQVRLKTYYAERAQIKRIEDIYRINNIDEQPLRITPEMISEAPLVKECANL